MIYRARYARKLILRSKYLKIQAANPWHQPRNVKNKRKNYNVKKHKSKFNKMSNDIRNRGDGEDEISIQKLNDDCLMHIFCHLPIIDKIRAERGKYIHFCSYSINIVLKYIKWIFMYIYVSVHRIFSTILVCKRWKALIKKSWYNMKRLDLLYTMWGSLADINGREVTIHMIRKILYRCGSYLNEVDLSLVPCYVHQHAVTIIGKLCRNLQIIDITGLRVSRSGIYSLINNCHKLTKLSIGPTTYACDIDLQKLFQMNPKLQYFKVYQTPISGRCLLHLPMNIEEIVLNSCKHLQEISLLEVKLSVYFYCLSESLIE